VHKIKKIRFLSALLAVAMLVALMPVTALAAGEPPVLQSAEVTATGHVWLTFDKAMAIPGSGAQGFTVADAYNTSKEVTAVSLSGDSTKILLTLGTTIKGGEAPWLSYTPGVIKASDGGELAGVVYLGITNTLPHPTLDTSSPSPGIVGTVYPHIFTATGGTGPYSFSKSSGSLPNGLTLGADGVLSGTPTAVGNFTFKIMVTDSTLAIDEHEFSITIGASPIVSATISPATVTFDKNPVNQADVSTTVTWNDAVSVTDVKKAGISVGAGVYAVDGNTLTIHKEYLTLQPVGSSVLTVEFDIGNTAALTIEVSDTTPPIGSNPPTWPAGSTMTASGTTKIGTTLNWTEAQDDVGITGYRIYQDDSLLQTVAGTVYSCEVTGLSSSTTYTFQVQAGDGSNQWTTDGPTETIRTKSSGSGGGDSASSTPLYNMDVITGHGSETTLPVTVNKDNGSASIDVSSQSGLVMDGTVITVPSIPGVDAYSVSIPVSYLSTSDGQGTLTINTNTGSITVASNMLMGVSGADGNKAEISLSQGDKSSLPEAAKTAIGDRPLIQLSVAIDGKQTDWNNPYAPVTVSIPYTPTAAELANPESIVIWYIDGNGNAVSVPNGRYDLATGTATFFTTHFSHYAVAYVHKTFSDLGSVEWARKAIEVMASKGITNGTGKDTFSPGANITRADYMVLLINTLGLTADFTENFDDVKTNAYYYNAVGIAKKLDIAAGSGNNRFNPTESISRQDMMVLAARALEKCQGLQAADNITVLDKFSDKGDITEYAAGSFATLVDAGLIEGSGNKQNPHSYTTRAEVAVFLYNVYNKYPEAPVVAASTL